MNLAALLPQAPGPWRRMPLQLLAACALAQAQPMAGGTTCLPRTTLTRPTLPKYCFAIKARQKKRLGGGAGDAEDPEDADGGDAGDGGSGGFSGNWGGRWDDWWRDQPEGGGDDAQRRAFPATFWLEYGLAKALGLWQVLCVCASVQAALFLAPAALQVLCTSLLPLSLLGLTQRTLLLNPAFHRL